MKHNTISPLLAILLFIISQNMLRCQEYIPMAMEGAQWIIRFDDINTPQTVDDLWEYLILGDTTIENFDYTKVYRRSLVPTDAPPPFIPNGEYELYGFLRDDHFDKKVYAFLLYNSYDCPVNEDFLLYDFSVQVGDTARFCLIPDFMEYVLASITPGVHLDFGTRIFSNGIDPYNYYEGMGSYYGLFEAMFTPVKSSHQKYTQHTFLYYYCREAPCDLVVSVPEMNNNENTLQFYPSPADQILIVSFLEKSIAGEIVIMNIQGQTMMRKYIRGQDKTVIINIGSLPTGLYFINYYRKGVLLNRQKLIVSR
ncbi:MAG: T9SS type A sorting domain-containing protein [Bacteroidales bacterium]|nr:T9SS type A sorting domain-containing protein [Bacteroidales bacterium]